MAETDFDAEGYIATMAPTLGLTIDGERRQKVATFLTIAKGMADLLDAAPVPEGTLALAATFTPLGPENTE